MKIKDHPLPSVGEVAMERAQFRPIAVDPEDVQEPDVKQLADAALKHCRVLEAEILRQVRQFQQTTGLCVESIEVGQTEITRLGNRELLPRVKVKVTL